MLRTGLRLRIGTACVVSYLRTGGIRYSSKYHASPRSSSLAPSGLSAADLQQSRGSPGKGWSVYPRTEQNWIRPPASLGAISASTDSDDAKAVLRIEEQPTEEALHVWQSKRAVLFHAACLFDPRKLKQLQMSDSAAVNEDNFMATSSSSNSHRDRFLKTPAGFLQEGAAELLAALEAQSKPVYVAAPGLQRSSASLLGQGLGIPAENVLCNFAQIASPEAKLDSGEDGTAIQILRRNHPYEGIAVVGSTEAHQAAAQGADLFVAVGGSLGGSKTASRPDWAVRDFSQLTKSLKRHQIAFIGSGAWATAAAKLAAENIAKPDKQAIFQPSIKMWVYEEAVNGRKLSQIVNEEHQNAKYLPGVTLPSNIVACPDLKEVVKNATILVICTPHQFVYGICKELREWVDQSAIAISLTKGMRVRPEGPQLISEMVHRTLNIDCSVLMGANIAEEVAKGQLSEGTIGYGQLDHGQLFKKLFESEYYLCTLVNDVAGAEMAGTLKNVVALGAGFVDGLGGGANPKATIIRCGLLEMRLLSQKLYPAVQDATFLESCGAADLVASCYGGRNRRVAEAYVRSLKTGTRKTFEHLEEELLKGQKLQGVLTSNEVQQVLEMRKWQSQFPLFVVINAIVNGRLPPNDIYRFKDAAERLLQAA